MTTFGATTTAPITVPGSTPTSDCEEGQQDCGGETDAPDDYDVATGKPPKLQNKEFLSDLFTQLSLKLSFKLKSRIISASLLVELWY